MIMSADDKAVQEIREEIEAALAEAFPGTHFEVKASGESTVGGHPDVTVRWTDGPSIDRVTRVCAPFDPSYSGGPTTAAAPEGAGGTAPTPVRIAPQRRFTERFYTKAVAAEAKPRGLAVPEVRTRKELLTVAATDFGTAGQEMYALAKHIDTKVSAET